MIDVMENIKKLSAALDAETASLHPSGKLLLLGSQDSVFLKAIKRKADQLGINNVSLGVGSFSMQCLETMDGGERTYAPYTRDTFGIAVKATYAEDADGKPIMIFKNPKTDSGHFKKSQHGCCKVVYDYTYHNFFCQDGLTWEESQVGNWLQPVFKDGKLLRIYTLDEVRKNLHEGNF